MRNKVVLALTLSFFAMSAVAFLGSQSVTPSFGSVPAAPTGDYLSFAILASLLALAGVSVLLAFKRKKK